MVEGTLLFHAQITQNHLNRFFSKFPLKMDQEQAGEMSDEKVIEWEVINHWK